MNISPKRKKEEGKNNEKFVAFFSFSRKWLTIQPKQITHTCTVFRNRQTRAAPTRPRPTDRFRRHTQFHWISWIFVWSRFHVRRGFFTWNCYVVDFFSSCFLFIRSFVRSFSLRHFFLRFYVHCCVSAFGGRFSFSNIPRKSHTYRFGGFRFETTDSNDTNSINNGQYM